VFHLLITAAVSWTGMQECMDQLQAHSPVSDISVAENLTVLEENAELALWTRENTPWGPLVPDSVFLRYVLPARVSQEPLVAWRPVFMDALLPVISGSETAGEAVLVISSWCDSIIDYAPTQYRDQSPFVTWSSGIGRCEEMTVFFMCALRSVGIPCRQVYTPWWSTVDGNHAWPEVWTPDGWAYTDISSELQTLNDAWFTERARSTALVVAMVPDSLGGALRYYGDASSVNVTRDYAPSGILVLEDPDESVTVSIMNWGSYRPLAVMDSLHASIELGDGSYLLTWGWPVNSQHVDVAAGDTVRVRLAGGDLPGHMVMNLREDAAW